MRSLVLGGFLLVLTAHAEAPSASRLEARLLAPCCWIQTLDIHDSPMATELRAEIAARLEAGELPESIEDDLAVRFGQRIRAAPRGSEPRELVPLVGGVAMLLALVGLGWMGRSWSRHPEPPPPGPTEYASDVELEEALARIDQDA
jgi:cytochrome c-type biogenesis protein CcmH